MALSMKLVSALFFAAVIVSEIQGLPEPGVHHYTYQIPGGANTETYLGGTGGAGGQDLIIQGQQQPGGTVTYVGGNGNSGDTGTSDLTNYGANAGDTRKRGQDCNRGLIDKAARGARNALVGAASTLNSAVSGATNKHGLLHNVGAGLNHVFGNIVSGARKTITDAACGLGNMANEAATALDTGDILGGVKNMAHEFTGGLGNMAHDITGGVGNAASALIGDAQDLKNGK